MSAFRKKPVDVECHQWFKNGDHPGDGASATCEGKVVRYFRRPEPEFAGDQIHDRCGRIWHEHGWIDAPGGGQTVCPGDWILTLGVAEYRAMRPDQFEKEYEQVRLCDVTLVNVNSREEWPCKLDLDHGGDWHEHPQGDGLPPLRWTSPDDD